MGGWLMWWVLLAAWTVGLLIPDPQKISVLESAPETGFVIAKSCHVVVYAVLAGMLVWLPGRPSWRWRLVVVLSLHGCGTEFLQRFTGRTGSLRDVVLDHVGISLGCLLTWWCFKMSQKGRRRGTGLRQPCS